MWGGVGDPTEDVLYEISSPGSPWRTDAWVDKLVREALDQPITISDANAATGFPP